MTRTVSVAAVRLCNDPAPTEERLRVAETQIISAARQGAQLIVLPEVFNTGYIYSDENYARAETMGGSTVAWMNRMAAEHNVHLAGTLMLLGPEHITNSLLLFAPDGRFWRYDKNHPWVWERAYFREGTDITVAETDLGTFGLMICADVLWPRLFKRYAGKVDALLVCASPPRTHEAVFHFPDGEQATYAELMRFPDAMLNAASCAFGDNVCHFARWMNVPVVQTTAYGHFSSYLPSPRLTFAILLGSQWSRWRYWFQADKITITANYFTENQIIDCAGNVLARYDDDADGFALGTIELADSRPKPSGKMPSGQPLGWISDISSWLLIPKYRRGVRRAWGKHMAPVDLKTQIWGVVVLLVGLVGYLKGCSKRCRS